MSTPPTCIVCKSAPCATSGTGSGFRRLCRSCWTTRRAAIRAARRAGLQHVRGSPVDGSLNASRPRHQTGRVVVVLSDVHVPEHDRGAWAVALEVIRRSRPDEVVLAGDFGEWESVSSHGAYNEARLLDDVGHVKQALDEIREACGPKCRVTFLEGNHETRLLRAVSIRAPSLAGALTLPDLLGLRDRQIDWIPESAQPIRRGLLSVLHGHQIFGQGGGPTYHAAKALQIYAAGAGGVVTYGHTHKPQTIQRATTGGALRAVGLGCLRTIRPDEVGWLRGAEAGWSHMFAVFTVLHASVHVEEVRPVRGQAVFRGRLVGARGGPDAS